MVPTCSASQRSKRKPLTYHFGRVTQNIRRCYRKNVAIFKHANKYYVETVIYMQPDQIINFIGAILGGGIIGAIISALATIFYGERRVETLRRRREHSIKLNDGVLKPWLSNVRVYCKIGETYSFDVHKIVGLEPKDPTDLEYFDVAKSHLESKYPDIIEAWEDLKHATLEHNKDLAILLEEIRTLTIEELKMPPYYSGMRGRSPKEYITLDRFVETIYHEIASRTRMHAQARAEHRVHPERKWMIGKPSIHPVIHGEEKFHELSWGSYTLVWNLDEEEVKRAKALIDKILDTSKFKEEVKNLIEREDMVHKTKREVFEMKIKDLIKSIELGNILKGKCRFCS